MQTLHRSVVALTLVFLTGCADPAVWSAVAPGYENGVSVSRVAVHVDGVREPGRSWSKTELIDELTQMGVATTAASREADAILSMSVERQRYVTIYVPVTHHPGKTTVTTYEKDGKTITEVEERAGYTTGGYSYDVPEATAAFTLHHKAPHQPNATIWTARALVQGQQNAKWEALAVDMAQRAVRQLKRDKVILPVQASQTAGYMR